MLAQDEDLTAVLPPVSQPDSTSPAAQLPRPGAVKARLTPKRTRRQVENDEYAAFVRRVLRVYSRRVGDDDVEALVLLVGWPRRSMPRWPKRSRACAPTATPGLRSAHGSGSAARPHSSAGVQHLDPAARPVGPPTVCPLRAR